MTTFIKILRYDLAEGSDNQFEYLCNLTLGKINPNSLEIGLLEIHTNVVLCSTMNRATTCINMENKNVIKLKILDEILFNLKEICNAGDYRVNDVRKGFKQKFIKDQLFKSRSFLFQEIEELVKIIQSFNEPITVVSHSFRLKIIQAYIESKRKIISNPEIINEYIQDDKNTYEFGENFKLNL